MALPYVPGLCLPVQCHPEDQTGGASQDNALEASAYSSKWNRRIAEVEGATDAIG